MDVFQFACKCVLSLSKLATMTYCSLDWRQALHGSCVVTWHNLNQVFVKLLEKKDFECPCSNSSTAICILYMPWNLIIQGTRGLEKQPWNNNACYRCNHWSSACQQRGPLWSRQHWTFHWPNVCWQDQCSAAAHRCTWGIADVPDVQYHTIYREIYIYCCVWASIWHPV